MNGVREKIYDVIIVGAGPAGLTAAIYARRAAKSVLVLEGRACGGQIVNTPDIENFPTQAHISGFEFAQKLFEQTVSLGAEIVYERAIGAEGGAEITVITKNARYPGRTLIIASGSADRKLGLENEEELIGRGVSYCATCDGNFFRNKPVAVVGGGNTALDDALYLSGIASKVFLIHRRDSFRGAEATVRSLKSRDNVEFVLNSVVTSLIADKRLTAVEIADREGQKRILAVNGLFVAVGRVPENGAFSDLVELDKAGYAIAGEDCRTKTPGVFVAGDCRTKELRQLVTAASDGAVAANAAVKYLSGQT